jgi:hypothetical protein
MGLQASFAHAIGTGGRQSPIFRWKQQFVMPADLNFIHRIMKFL